MTFPDSQVMNYLVRMVVPMRREFGRSLDVQNFLHDGAYAREVLGHALNSQDARLREYATYVEKALYGPRATEAPRALPAAPAAAVAAAPAAASEDGDPEEQAMKALIMKRYTAGLR
jgi:hypothetical protein